MFCTVPNSLLLILVVPVQRQPPDGAGAICLADASLLTECESKKDDANVGVCALVLCLLGCACAAVGARFWGSSEREECMDTVEGACANASVQHFATSFVRSFLPFLA